MFHAETQARAPVLNTVDRQRHGWVPAQRSPLGQRLQHLAHLVQELKTLLQRAGSRGQQELPRPGERLPSAASQHAFGAMDSIPLPVSRPDSAECTIDRLKRHRVHLILSGLDQQRASCSMRAARAVGTGGLRLRNKVVLVTEIDLVGGGQHPRSESPGALPNPVFGES